MTNEEFLAEVQRRTGSHPDTMLTDVRQAQDSHDIWALLNCAAWLLAILTGKFDNAPA